MRHVHCFNALILGLALVVAGTSFAGAQGLPGGASSLNETHGDWSVACQAADGEVRCAIAQTQVRGENRQRVLSVELTGAEVGAASGVMILPFGLRLDAGVVPSIDETAPMPTLRFSTCLPAGCLVPLAFDAATLEALRAGTALQIRATANEAGQDVAFSISLSGFASALDRLAELTAPSTTVP